MNRFCMFSAFLLISFAAHSAQPPEVGSATTIAVKPADDRIQSNAACASDGEGTFLVTWQQGQKFYKGKDPKVFAARISVEGKVLDETPIAVSSADNAQERPRVSFSNGVFLVVWQVFNTESKTWDVSAARIKPDSALLDEKPITVSAGSGNQALPDVTNTPKGFLVVWQDDRSGNGFELWTATIDAEGKVKDESALKAKDKSLRGGTPWIVSTDNGWFVQWKAAYDTAANPSYHLVHIQDVDGSLKAKDLGRFEMMMTFYNGYLVGGKSRVLALNGSFFRGSHTAYATMFDATTGEAIKNTNPEKDQQRWGNKTNKSFEFQFLARKKGHGEGGFIPPKSGAAIGDFFLVVVRAAREQKQEKTGPYGLELLRIAGNGVRVDDITKLPVLDDAKTTPVFNPVATGLKDGVFLVAYESSGGPGKHVIKARIVKTEMPENPEPLPITMASKSSKKKKRKPRKAKKKKE